jgi:hypothetical protein
MYTYNDGFDQTNRKLINCFALETLNYFQSY